jgi:two-component system sensor histidine kinase RpfC
MIRTWGRQLKTLFGKVAERVRARPDTEFQQTFLRVVFVSLLYVYFSLDLFDQAAEMRKASHVIVVIFLCTSIILMASTLANTSASAVRRIVGALLDFAGITTVLLVGNQAATPILFAYLWVIMGNGLRYGVAYLFASTLLACIGFSTVLFFNPFWHSNITLGISFLICILVVPLYSGTLLQRLHRAISKEKAANQAKSQFLANMSHELRTPLNGVIGVAHLLEETRLDREQRELIQIVRSSADTLLGLIDNVLDFSRIEAGRLILADEAFDLHLLVNRIVQMLKPAAQKKGLTLAAHIAPQTPFRLSGDAPHLRQVLINLIGNAIKFTESGRVDLYIRPVGLSVPPRLQFEVVDTGIGIPVPAQATVFKSFTQADASITRRFGGSGLGTTIAKQLVELMGGRIGLRSEEGVGSVFWFEIPFTSQARPETGQRAEERLNGQVALLVPDAMRPRLDEMVRSWGLDALPLTSDREVAEVLGNADTGSLAAVVLARNCLADDPLAFIRALGLSGQKQSRPVILIETSGDADPRFSETRLTQAGYEAVLTDPVNPSLLFNAIHAAMSGALPGNVVSIAEHFQNRAGGMRLRMLVADDNPVNLRVTQGIMEHAGHEVLTVNDGEQALDVLEAEGHNLDLAIIDMQMPGLSGLDVVRHWRIMEMGHLPIIMLTADAREESMRICREAGADVFLTKPINGIDLIETVARLATTPGSDDVWPAGKKARAAVLLDETILDDLASVAGGHVFIEGLIHEFTGDSLHVLDAVERAQQDRDYPAWKEQLHMLKGGANDVGALQLAKTCEEAERIQPYELGGPLSRERLGRVREAWEAAGKALSEYLSRQSSLQRH